MFSLFGTNFSQVPPRPQQVAAVEVRLLPAVEVIPDVAEQQPANDDGVRPPDIDDFDDVTVETEARPRRQTFGYGRIPDIVIKEWSALRSNGICFQSLELGVCTRETQPLPSTSSYGRQTTPAAMGSAS